MAIEAISELGGPVVVVVVTVTVELAEITPVKPFMLAVIWMTPWPVDVTNPEEFTDATSGPVSYTHLGFRLSQSAAPPGSTTSVPDTEAPQRELLC